MPFVGVLLIVLGVANLVLPFVGPTFGFGMGPDPAWALTGSRIVRHIIPDAAIIAGGIMLLPSARASRVVGGYLAVLGGVWLTVAPIVLGPVSGEAPAIVDVARRLSYHFGTGAIIIALAAFALGAASGRWATERRIADRDQPHTRETAEVR